MAQRTDILKELEGMSPAVAAIRPAETFRVPEGYFDRLPALVLKRIQDEQENTVIDFGNKLSPYTVPAGYFDKLPEQIMEHLQSAEIEPLLPVEAKENAYSVPEGYFDNLSSAVISRIKAGSELTSYLLNKKEDTYKVPEGYFNSLANDVMNRIKAAEVDTAKEEISILSPVLGGLDKKMPFAAPTGYFNELPENVIAGAQAIEFVNGTLENLSPAMAGLKYINVYEAPEGYFENLSDNMLKAVKQQPVAGKVVSLSIGKRLVRYAAAAAVIGIVAIAGWLFVKQSGDTANPDMELQAKLKSFENDSEIVNYVENTAAVAEMNSTNTVDIKGEDIKDMLADVSDEELQHYLESQSGRKEGIN